MPLNMLKILYVDDEQPNLLNFSIAFRSYYEILTAQSGEEALKVFEENPEITVVVADQRMPGMTGVELLRHVRKINPDVVRIILTAYTDVTDVIDSINQGKIYHFVVKPWGEEELLQLLKKATNTYLLINENKRLFVELDEKNEILKSDIARRKELEAILLRRDMVLAAVTNMAQALLLNRDWTQYVEQLMGRMGLVMGLSRIRIYQYFFDENRMLQARQRYKWIAEEGMPPGFAESLSNNVTYQEIGFEHWFRTLSHSELIYGNCTDLLQSEKDFCRCHQIKSIVVAPIMVDDDFWGVIDFEDCVAERDWPRPELDALKTAASLIGTAIAREKTEKRLAAHQAQLAHAGRLTAMGEMASGISHEIYQPLTVINLNAEICKNYFDRQGLCSPAAEAAEEIRIHVNKITSIINSMRSFSRSSSGGREKISLIQPLQEALIFFREQFHMHGIEFEEQVSDDLPLVKTVGQKFEQIVVNLLSNARYAVDIKSKKDQETRKKISVILRCVNVTDDALKKLHFKKDSTTSSQVIVFEVVDNGIGMSNDVQKRCLEPFFTTKEVGEGTGLGLSVTLGIIRELNFHLDIDSREGEGSTFRVVIPVDKQNRVA